MTSLLLPGSLDPKARYTPSRWSAVGQFLFVGRLSFLSVFRTVGWSWSSSAFSIRFHMLNRHRSVGPSDHSDRLFSWRTSAREKRRMDVLLGHRVSSIGLVCQGNFGPRRCRREPTPQSAFVATSLSASAWCVPGLKAYNAIPFQCYFTFKHLYVPEQITDTPTQKRCPTHLLTQTCCTCMTFSSSEH